jgi:hypothetical protein
VSFIRWRDLDAMKVERAIKSLILETHPGAWPIDGSGGDGGRDVCWNSPDGLVIFEIKSYVDRLGPTQKRNIKASLDTASQHQPVRWVLVLPLDRTPAELTWFDQLDAGHPGISLDWYGLTWLDVEFSKRGHLRRMVEGDDYRLLELATEFDKEQAALLRGMPDAIDRMSRIMEHAQDLSPYWVAEVTTGRDGLNVRYRERYPGAARLDPIAPKPTYLFPSGDPHAVETQRRLEDFEDYGGDVHVDGKYVVGFDLDVSAESRSLFAPMTEGTTAWLRFTSLLQESEQPLVLQLVAVAASGTVKGRLQLQIAPPTEGRRGIRIRGTDSTGTIRIVFTSDRPAFGPAYQVDIAVTGIAGKLPYAIRPAFDVFGRLTDDGDRIELRINDQPMCNASDLAVFVAEARLSAQVLASLDLLQTHAQVFFPVPDDLTYEDASGLIFGARLVAGESVRSSNYRVGLTIRHDKLEDFVASDAALNPGALTAEFTDYAIELGPYRLPLGTVSAVAPKVLLTNLDELRAAVGTGEELTARYECAEGEGIYYRLGPLGPTSEAVDG